jgi:hypothetical protein
MSWGPEQQGALGGGASGAASGAMMGAMMGSVVPGLGTGVGALVGAGVGLLGGGAQGLLSGSAKKKQAKALARQQAAIKAEQKRRNANVGQVRDLYGALPTSGEKYRTMGKTLQNRGLISGAIEDQASAVRAAGQTGLVDAAQAAGAARRGSVGARGLLGSSLDAASKQQLLGSYLGGKAGVVGAAEDVRQSGWGAVEAERQGLEGVMRQGADMSGVLGGMARASAINQAKTAIPYQAFGQLLGDAMDFTTTGAKAYQGGGQGLTAFSLSQPRLGGSDVPGAYQSKRVA